ncbi:acyl-CoA thioesterase [Dimargaris xerosporica]|nr:acyl-CoA thioesterase [Dimargaris xerosporica]
MQQAGYTKTRRTYATRTVHAQQKANRIFTCTCSFQADRPTKLDHQFAMPAVPPPESLELQEDVLKRWAQMASQMEDKAMAEKLKDPDSIPLDIKKVGSNDLSDYLYPTKQAPYKLSWIKTKETLDNDLRLHQCALAYISDHHLVHACTLPHALTWGSYPWRIGMMVSLDHTIWFHAPFRADGWLLYEMESPRTLNGRGLVFGRVYTREGLHVASVAQECVFLEKPAPQAADTLPDPQPITFARKARL